MIYSKKRVFLVMSVLLATLGTSIAQADVSTNTVTIRSVTPLAGVNSMAVAVTPAAGLCGGKTNFYITDTDTSNGKAMVAAALTALAAAIPVRPQVAGADCGDVWPALSGLGLVSS